MGHQQSREGGGGPGGAYHHGFGAAGSSSSSARNPSHNHSSGHPGNNRDVSYSSRRTRQESSALDMLTGGRSSSRLGGGAVINSDQPFQPRESKQDRENRRLERERAARVKERERSLRVGEHVDGGYLVTMGVYMGVEDFNKPIVRQFQIERKIAPFWRGLNDFDSKWTEAQIVAVARGLEMPSADVPLEQYLAQLNLTQPKRPPLNHLQADTSQSQPAASPGPTSSSPPSNANANLNMNSLTVTMGPRSLSAASDRTGSNPPSSLPSPSGPPGPSGPSRLTSSLKPHKKVIEKALQFTSSASSSSSPRNASAINNNNLSPPPQDTGPREIMLPQPRVYNGQPLEVALYRDGEECPVCFMYYPRFMNRTRCCDQPICSECFVQIKRPDPHVPEHHPTGDGQSQPGPPNPDERTNPNVLVSEPACCPYCTAPEFGVTYQPPPFRRGIAYQQTQPGCQGTPASAAPESFLASPTQAASPNSTPNSPPLGSPLLGSPPLGRRRTHTLSVDAEGVIGTDRIRPDWEFKLQAARSQRQRRAAAADAVHQAAFVMNEDVSGRLFGRPFGRRGASSVFRGNQDGPGPSSQASGAAAAGPVSAAGAGTGARGNAPPGARHTITPEHLEHMMLAEAIRQSIVDEEERRKKLDKDAAKEATARQESARKEEKAAQKQARKDAKKKEKEEGKGSRLSRIYSHGPSSASASSLSMNLLPWRQDRQDRQDHSSSSQALDQSPQAAASSSGGMYDLAEASEARPGDSAGEDSSGGMSTKPLDKGKGVDRSSPLNALDPGVSSSSGRLEARTSGENAGGANVDPSFQINETAATENAQLSLARTTAETLPGVLITVDSPTTVEAANTRDAKHVEAGTVQAIPPDLA